MGCKESKPVTQGAVIVDSVVISNSRARVDGDLVQIPIKSLKSGEASVITIDRKGGVVRVSRGLLHGTLSHHELLNDLEEGSKRSDDGIKKRYVHHEELSIKSSEEIV